MWLVIALLGIGAVLGLWANARYHWLAGWAYSRRAAHVAVEAPQPELVYADMYGSMIWAEEQALLAAPLLQEQYAQIVGGPDWREQTAADLSPEALAEDSGPGVLSLVPPGPDPSSDNDLDKNGPEIEFAQVDDDGQPDTWLDGQLADLYAWVRAQWEGAAA